ncbi:hypothetical protein DFH27DRAFT_650169 [Peziza echinospora]|nr:hypothetical protein DFH27DRAFT_650169 [Peziza echinospora]
MAPNTDFFYTPSGPGGNPQFIAQAQAPVQVTSFQQKLPATSVAAAQSAATAPPPQDMDIDTKLDVLPVDVDELSGKLAVLDFKKADQRHTSRSPKAAGRGKKALQLQIGAKGLDLLHSPVLPSPPRKKMRQEGGFGPGSATSGDGNGNGSTVFTEEEIVLLQMEDIIQMELDQLKSSISPNTFYGVVAAGMFGGGGGDDSDPAAGNNNSSVSGVGGGSNGSSSATRYTYNSASTSDNGTVIHHGIANRSGTSTPNSRKRKLPPQPLSPPASPFKTVDTLYACKLMNKYRLNNNWGAAVSCSRDCHYHTSITGRYLELLASPTKLKWERETRRREDGLERERVEREREGAVRFRKGRGPPPGGRRPGYGLQQRRTRVVPGSRFGKGKAKEGGDSLMTGMGMGLERETEREKFSLERVQENREMWGDVFAEFAVPEWVVETLRGEAEREAEEVRAKEREEEEWRMHVEMQIEGLLDSDVNMSGTSVCT